MALIEMCFIPWGKNMSGSGWVEAKLKKETAKAYLLRVEDGDRAVEFWVPKSQSRLVSDGIWVKRWILQANPEAALASLMLGNLLKEVEA